MIILMVISIFVITSIFFVKPKMSIAITFLVKNVTGLNFRNFTEFICLCQLVSHEARKCFFQFKIDQTMFCILNAVHNALLNVGYVD